MVLFLCRWVRIYIVFTDLNLYCVEDREMLFLSNNEKKKRKLKKTQQNGVIRSISGSELYFVEHAVWWFGSL